MFEELAVNQLLRTPAFHRAVETVVKNAHRLRYGVPPDEMGGAKLEQPDSQFGQHFLSELKAQLGATEKKQIADVESAVRAAAAKQDQTTETQEQNAEAVWQEIQRRAGGEQKAGFMSDYAQALRGQVGTKKSGD